MFLKGIDRFNPKSVLEVGCGNSVWLPYLAKKRNLRVFGLDYSEEGCELARIRLATEKVVGTVFCGDLFSPDIKGIGQFDFVYSIGVVEHFSDLENVLSNLLKFVKPGGVLLTEVPNLYSVHGIMTFLYQPELFRKHRILKKKELQAAYSNAGLSATECNYAGVFSLGIVSWGIYQRFPSLDKKIVPLIKKIQDKINPYLIKAKKYDGAFVLAPFLYAVGKKPG
jgi:SAM-dependent methyltransferase